MLDAVMADRGCFACMLGRDNGRTLYIVANHYSDRGASDGVILVPPGQLIRTITDRRR